MDWLWILLAFALVVTALLAFRRFRPAAEAVQPVQLTKIGAERRFQVVRDEPRKLSVPEKPPTPRLPLSAQPASKPAPSERAKLAGVTSPIGNGQENPSSLDRYSSLGTPQAERPNVGLPPIEQLKLSEKISVILRRQVPVRFDEPPRSWLGGLPMMPHDIEWPVGPTQDYPERGDTPLHFAAQIACADLPADLWGGLGPRSGWLLLFINGQEWSVDEDDEPGRAIRVLHIDALGPERTPPPGIYPVHDEMYSGSDYKFVRSQDEVPTVWRRWPVDLVAVPNNRIEGKEYTTLPDNFSAILYDGAEVVDDPYPRPPENPPFSWRGALYVVDSIHRMLAKPRSAPQFETYRQQLLTQDWHAAIQQVETLLAKWNASLTPQDVSEEGRARDEKRREKIAAHERELALLHEAGDAQRLLMAIEAAWRRYEAWFDTAPSQLSALRARILAHDLDTRLDPDDWEMVRSALSVRQPYWLLQKKGDLVLPLLVDRTLLDLASTGLRAAQVELAADYYVSRDLKALIPAPLLSFMEPRWRSLLNNRPHRIGGHFDGVQSSIDEAPADSMLLFQIASDQAMNWQFGDYGAYYVHVRSDRLASNDLRKTSATFECG